MKAIIPVAGAGTRLRPLTYTQPKPLIPIAGKPIISFMIDQLVDAGIRDFVFVIGYLGEKIRNYVELTYPDLNKEYVTQENRRGSAHALYTARNKFKDADDIFIFFGDVIIDADFKAIVKHPSSCIGIKKVSTPWEFGIVEVDKEGKISRLVEKPKIPKSDMAMVGFYKIKEVGALVEALEYNINHNIMSADEFPLTDALMRMVKKGVTLEPVGVDNWFDCGKSDVLLETNATFLDREGYATSNTHSFDNSIIIHPVSIGSNCEITNSIVGPHVTIGDNTKIRHAIVYNSIIGNFASIKEVILQKSIVGNDASITGIRQSLNLGDNTEIDFSSSD